MITDKLGQEIKAGVWVLYGHNIGRCAGLRLGLVIDVARGPENERCPWLTNDRITVWGIDDDHLEYYKYHANEPHSDWARPKPLSKKSTLLFSSRCVVVPASAVPKEYRNQIEMLVWKVAPKTALPPGDPHLAVCKDPKSCKGNCYEI